MSAVQISSPASSYQAHYSGALAFGRNTTDVVGVVDLFIKHFPSRQ